MGVDLDVPDHTTLSRRSQRLEVGLRHTTTKAPIHLVVDSSGLSIVGEGEWAAVKHGGKGKRGWKKLHLGVDRSGVIVAQVLTDGSADDAKTRLALIEAVEGDIASITADAAYDTIAIYEAADARGASVVVPPTKTATVSRRGRRSTTRDRTIRRVKKIGRRRWKKESGYHRQARAENAFFRYIAPGQAWRKGTMRI
jgi:IS5 family transposase